MTMRASRMKALPTALFLLLVSCAWDSGWILAQSHPFAQSPRLLGLYVFVGEKLTSDASPEIPAKLLPFAKFCGYNTLELADWSFEYPDNLREDYLKASRSRIATAHHEGFKIFIILATNMSRQWASERSGEPSGDNLAKLLFNPVERPVEFQERISAVREAVQKGFSDADGFEVFAGDWGGCIGESCSYEQYLGFGRAYRQILTKLGIKSELTLNTWAIANWGVTLDPMKLALWDAEIDLSKKLIASDISFADAITLPGHNLYRFLVRQLYTEAKRPVPNWPDRAAIESIHAKGKRAYLWPHFIVGDARSRQMTWRKVHFDVRYLKELAENIRTLGTDGEFVNAYNPAFDMGNMYAYAQLHRDPAKQPRAILREFASLVAEPSSVDQLAEVFTFIENHSWWGSQMPPQFRLRALPCKLSSYNEVLAATDQVVPLPTSPAPLMMSPKAYLAEVKSTLLFMKNNYGY